ncbi:hypothetical protein [Akkermansia sp.]|uniref:hypothetical protein n=1 Tax=Akkermansia sp. TaxID=1872421 RepID=UPI0025C10044|nr:hypothetical protein [Akkermansia sp.]MCD8063536.1 hypothetical protein [Akkermansia sp.]
MTADDNGQIQLKATGNQYLAVDFLTIKGDTVPEPALATLGLAGPGILMLRRRR